MRCWFTAYFGVALFCAWESPAAATGTSAPPANIVFVPHPYASRLAKHPTLPVLYLGLSSAPESKNLATFGLDSGGNILTNTMRTSSDFLTDDGKNPTNQYWVMPPIVLPAEKVLLLAAVPANYLLYHANTNAQHIAAVALDDQGQPITSDGTAADYAQAIVGSPGPFGVFEVSPELRKVYIMTGAGLTTLSIYRLDKHGGFTGVPSRFAMGETSFICLDSKSRRLYSMTANGVLRVQPLDAEGWPAGPPGISQISCGAIRDVLLDEPTGKVYVACTQPPQPPP